MSALPNVVHLSFPVPKAFTPPSMEECQLHAAKIGLPDREAQKFWMFYDGKDWFVGKNKMKRWHSAMGLWRLNWGGTVQGITRHNSPSRSEVLDYAKSVGDVTGYSISWYQRRLPSNFINPSNLGWKELFREDFSRWKESLP